MEVKDTQSGEVKETIAVEALGKGVVIRTEVFRRQRLLSLDALRGFDMFWIIAGEHIFHGLAKASGHPFWQGLSYQLDHAEWHGFRAYDLIFPLFLFLAGVSTPFSVGRDMESGVAKSKLLARVVRRGLILALIGIYCNNGLKVQPLAEMRFCSVLGRIGLAYMFANIIYLYTKEKGQVIWFSTLLIGYWLLLRFTSAPGYPMGDLTMEGNFASYIDRLIVPGKLYLGVHDPEGLMSSIPAVCTAMLGIWTGNELKSRETAPEQKALRMALAGVACVAVSLVWNWVFPINKNLWTSSFVMLTGGLSLLLLSLFYYVIDVKGIKKWAFFFSVIGMNSILIYISSRFINWEHANNAFFKWVGQVVGDPYNVFAMAVCLTIVKWAFVYFLYKKKIFLRV